MHYLGLRYKGEHKNSELDRPRTKYLIFLDKLTLIVGIVGPFTVLPQIYTIFSTKTASGVSFLSWLLIFIVTFPWILYGIAHKDKNIIICFILWEIVNLGVIVGVALYGKI
jgi:uncharacterized protein with PQ loop repeat